MRDDLNAVVVGLTGVLLVWALAAGAAEPTRRVNQDPAPTAVLLISPPQIVPTPVKASEAPRAKAAAGCDGIIVSAGGLIFTDGFETGDTQVWEQGEQARFSTVRILDLDFTIRFDDGFSGDHLLHLKLLTPKGHHYQTLSTWMTSDPALRKSLRRVEGYPRPLAVRLWRKAGLPSLPEVTLSIPVGGTQIVTNSIYGMWTAEAYLDDQSEVCAAQLFILAP